MNGLPQLKEGPGIKANNKAAAEHKRHRLFRTNNSRLATVILLINFVAFVLAYHFRVTFAGRLLMSGFGAALIGGLADWYAVTALFGRPLGVPWKTDVIRRHRGQLFASLTDMVSDELLTTERLKKQLSQMNIAALLLAYLDIEEGRTAVKTMLHEALRQIIRRSDSGASTDWICMLVQENAGSFKLAPLLGQMIRQALIAGADDVLFDLAIELGEDVLASASFAAVLHELAVEVKKAYEASHPARRLLDALIGLSDGKLAAVAQAKLDGWLSCCRAPQTGTRQALRLWMEELAAQLDGSTDLARRVEAFKMKWIGENSMMEQQISRCFEAVKHIADEQPCLFNEQLRVIDRLVGSLLAHFRHDRRQQRLFNDFAIHLLMRAAGSWRRQIRQLVQENLQRVTDDQLVGLMKRKAGNDLQFVRINGSLVGGLTGLLIYLATFWIG